MDERLAEIPAHRVDDVVVIDPTQPNPVGLNPLITPGSSVELTADGILAIFKELWPSAFGGRTTDIGPMAAGALITIVPVIILFVFLQRQVTEGFISGAVKG
jgi:ABC-type glycerol-3-phosphate transport system permease component